MNREIHDAIRAHFRDRLARCTDFPLQEFRSYLADFPRIGAAEAASCEGVIIECEVHDVLKGRLIQDNLHLIREVLEEIEDGTEAALISLDQSKAFDRVDHRFLATVLETAGFQPEFCRWISMMYHNLQAVVQVIGRRSRAFAGIRDQAFGPVGLPPVSSSLCPRFGAPEP